MANIEVWTEVINEIVDILKYELEGGFLENTSKYKGEKDEIVYSCLRAIAVQILSIPKIKLKKLTPSH